MNTLAKVKSIGERSWLAAGTLLLSLALSGCQVSMAKKFPQLMHARVCPTCNARSVGQCHCFSARDNVGYNETSWTSLDATGGPVPYRPNPPGLYVSHASALADTAGNYPFAPQRCSAVLAEDLNFSEESTVIPVPTGLTRASTDHVVSAAFNARASTSSAHVRVSDGPGTQDYDPSDTTTYDYFRP